MNTCTEIEQEIVAKGLTAPRITPQSIEDNIKRQVFFTAADGIKGSSNPNGIPYEEHRILTLCVLTLKNGFTVVGKSACASPEKFDAELGRQIARQDAVNKIWPLEGYRLRSELAAAK